MGVGDEREEGLKKEEVLDLVGGSLEFNIENARDTSSSLSCINNKIMQVIILLKETSLLVRPICPPPRTNLCPFVLFSFGILFPSLNLQR